MNFSPFETLVLAEHDNHTLKSVTANTVSAAGQLNSQEKNEKGKVTILVAGKACEKVAQQASQLEGVEQVLLAEAAHYEHGLAENIVPLLLEVAKSSQCKYIIAPSTTYGKNILPRLAALLNVSQISDVIQIISNDTFVHPIYAGNALETVQSLDPIKVLTIRTIAFESAAPLTKETPTTTEPIAPIIRIPATEDLKRSSFIRTESSPTSRPELSAAHIVVSGGRGLQSKENFKLLESLADTLGAAIGASRAAVDAGFVPNDYQVGQTGKVVAPALYIAVGISGAIQHLAGMKDSKVIVAINKDSEAPIFQVADYGLVGDLFEILPELTKALAQK